MVCDLSSIPCCTPAKLPYSFFQSLSLGLICAMACVRCKLYSFYSIAQFLHTHKCVVRRLTSVRKAAEASGRQMCFLGLSLTTYLEAAHLEGRAPFNPKELVQPADIPNMDPNKLLIVTTGSQVSHESCLVTLQRELIKQQDTRLCKLLASP